MEEILIYSIICLLDINFENTFRRALVLVVIMHELLNKKEIVCDKTIRDEVGLGSLTQVGRWSFI